MKTLNIGLKIPIIQDSQLLFVILGLLELAQKQNQDAPDKLDSQGGDKEEKLQKSLCKFSAVITSLPLSLLHLRIASTMECNTLLLETFELAAFIFL